MPERGQALINLMHGQGFEQRDPQHSTAQHSTAQPIGGDVARQHRPHRLLSSGIMR